MDLSIEELARLWSRGDDADAPTIKFESLFQVAPYGSVGSFAYPERPPLSFRSSPYSIRVRDAALYATSALAALSLPFMVDEEVNIETYCPSDGTAIVIGVTRRGVTKCAPPRCVLSVITPAEVAGGSLARRVGTPQSADQLSRFFSSRKAAMTWLVAYPEVRILSIEAAWQLAALIQSPDKVDTE